VLHLKSTMSQNFRYDANTFFSNLKFCNRLQGPDGEYNVLVETLLPGKTMNVCDVLRSANGRNVYKGNGKAKWQSKSKSSGTGSWTITFKTDGNL
jgi:hypothetical protein